MNPDQSPSAISPSENSETSHESSDFAELFLPEPLLKAIDDLGFTSCTPIQKEVLPHTLDGEDLIGQAQTGTGKTAAFLITVITFHMENPEETLRANGTPFALIIAPTRELALQIMSDAEELTKYSKLNIVALVGGMDYDKQQKQCQKKVDLIIATPGRLLDFSRKGYVNLKQVEQLVIDEADRMLSMGFIPDLTAIVRQIPDKKERQTLLFSATYPSYIQRITEQWTHQPVTIKIQPDSIVTDTVEQITYLVETDKKYDLLYNLIQQDDVDRVIIFVNRRDDTRRLEEKLYRNDIETGLLTGEVPQKKRLRTLDDFKEGKIKVLVATDVAGRGIHVNNVTHVINYNLPDDPEDYIHRIGRTGRAGATGTSVTIACETECFQLPAIEDLLGTKIVGIQPEEKLLEKAPAPVKPRREKPVQSGGRKPHSGQRGRSSRR